MRYLWVGLVVLGLSVAQAGWKDLVDQAGGAVQGLAGTSGSAGAGLTDAEVSTGLKDALSVGVDRAIALLGKDGGYLNDAQVRIPMPGSLAMVEKGLRTVGQERLAEEFVATMNHAAEQAVPEAAGIFAGAIRGMTLSDARAVLNGPDDAATQYFREQTQSELTEAMLPIVRQATEQVGVTRAYKSLMAQAGPAAQLLGQQSLDLDAYVTGKALDGLFLKLAEQEKLIRTDPAARTTEILRQVFGG